MNEFSSRVETHGNPDADAPVAGPAVSEMIRRAESVRTTLVFAGIALVVALTVIVQSNAARRAAQQQPVAATGAQRQAAPQNAVAPGTHTAPGDSR